MRYANIKEKHTVNEQDLENAKRRFDDILDRSQKLGVLDINFSGAKSASALECYERTLEIIENNSERFDKLEAEK